MIQEERPLKGSVLLLLRNTAIAAVLGVVGYYCVTSGELLLIILGALFLFCAPILLLLPLFMGLPGRGQCPQCGGTIETMGSRDRNLMCCGCDTYLDAGGGKLKRSEPDRVEALPSFSAPSPWDDLTNIVYPTIAFSADDKIRDMLTTRNDGVRVMEAKWPQMCLVCGAAPARFDEMTRRIAKPGNIGDTEIIVAASDIPYCGQHSAGVIFERVDSATPGASGCFGLKFRSLAYRNAFMQANPWRFHWHR